MTTRTQDRTSSKAQPRTGKDQPNWGTRNAKMSALGLSSMDELRHYERFERGTNAQRQKPRKDDRNDERDHAVHVGNDKQAFLERLWDFMDREVGAESAFPKDGRADEQVVRGQQPGHVYGEGATVTVSLAGADHRVTITSCYDVFFRLRYRIEFANGAQMALTQAQLLKIRVDVPVALAPTHLLPAPTVPRFCYRDLVLEGAAAVRVQEHIARHWQRQVMKLIAPHGQELPRVLYA